MDWGIEPIASMNGPAGGRVFRRRFQGQRTSSSRWGEGTVLVDSNKDSNETFSAIRRSGLIRTKLGNLFCSLQWRACGKY